MGAAKAAPVPDDAAFSGRKRKGALALVLGLGLSAWVANLGWLTMDSGVRGVGLGWSLAALVPLGVGVLARLPTLSVQTRTAGRWLLLCAYPVALVAVLAVHAESELERVHTPLSLLLAALSLLAYAAGAAVVCDAELDLLPTVLRPLRAEPKPGSRTRHWLRIGLSLLWIAGALTIAIVAPLSPAFSEVEHAWGQAAAAGAVLAAVVASALAVTSIALFLGSMLRLADAEPPLRAAEARTRIAMLLFVALLGSVVYYTLVS